MAGSLSLWSNDVKVSNYFGTADLAEH